MQTSVIEAIVNDLTAQGNTERGEPSRALYVLKRMPGYTEAQVQQAIDQIVADGRASIVNRTGYEVVVLANGQRGEP